MSDTEYYYPDEGSIFSRRHRRSHSPAVSNSSIDSSPNPYIRFKRPNAARYEMVPFEKCRTFEGMHLYIQEKVRVNQSGSRLEEHDYELLNSSGDIFTKEAWKIKDWMEVEMCWKTPSDQPSLGPQPELAEEQPVGGAPEPEHGLGEAPTEKKEPITVKVDGKRYEIPYQEGRTKEGINHHIYVIKGWKEHDNVEYEFIRQAEGGPTHYKIDAWEGLVEEGWTVELSVQIAPGAGPETIEEPTESVHPNIQPEQVEDDPAPAEALPLHQATPRPQTPGLTKPRSLPKDAKKVELAHSFSFNRRTITTKRQEWVRCIVNEGGKEEHGHMCSYTEKGSGRRRHVWTTAFVAE